jgi:hypothetical protein
MPGQWGDGLGGLCSGTVGTGPRVGRPAASGRVDVGRSQHPKEDGAPAGARRLTTPAQPRDRARPLEPRVRRGLPLRNRLAHRTRTLNGRSPPLGFTSAGDAPTRPTNPLCREDPAPARLPAPSWRRYRKVRGERHRVEYSLHLGHGRVVVGGNPRRVTRRRDERPALSDRVLFLSDKVATSLSRVRVCVGNRSICSASRQARPRGPRRRNGRFLSPRHRPIKIVSTRS